MCCYSHRNTGLNQIEGRDHLKQKVMKILGYRGRGVRQYCNSAGGHYWTEGPLMNEVMSGGKCKTHELGLDSEKSNHNVDGHDDPNDIERE